MTILEVARSVKRGRTAAKEVNPEEVELAVAFANGEVSSVQAAKALGIATGSLQAFLARNIRKGVSSGLVKVSFIGNGGSHDQD